MATRIFISYRRSDSLSHAQHLKTILSQAFGHENVFLDLESIKTGENWSQKIRDHVSKSDVVIALVGDSWSAVEAGKERRIDDPKDLVRREIAEALSQDKIVIAALMDTAKLPNPDTLPAELQQLAARQTAVLRAADFAKDSQDLIPIIRRLVTARRRKSNPTRNLAIAAILGAVLSAAAIRLATPLFDLCTSAATENLLRNLKNEVHAQKQAITIAEERVAARLPNFREIDASGPWSIAWKWDAPKCEGAYNLVVQQNGQFIQVFGKEKLMQGHGQALTNGHFFVQFAIDTGKYELRAEGNLVTGKGEAELIPLAPPDARTYCSGGITLSRGKMPAALTGGGNGGGN